MNKFNDNVTDWQTTASCHIVYTASSWFPGYSNSVSIHTNGCLYLLYIVLLSIGILCGAYAPAYAADDEQRNPLGCRDVGYRFELKTLDIFPAEAGERNSLYFIRNKLEKPVHLYQMRQDESTHSTYINHKIHPGRWAVLSTCEKELKYVCTVDDGKTKYGKVVDCENSLQVCEFARVRFGLNNRGNHWIVNSNTRNGAVREVVRYGIIPQ